SLKDTLGYPKILWHWEALFSKVSAASWLTNLGVLPRSFPNSLATHRIETVSGPVTFSNLAGDSQIKRDLRATSLASPCQMTFMWPLVRSISLSSCTI